MSQEINSVNEMLRRLLFLAYASACATYLVLCVVALARPGIWEVCSAAAVFAVALLLRQAGYRWGDFARLRESFPAGCPQDLVPAALREEVEALIDEFVSGGSDWVRRNEIRHRLIELQECSPAIREAYRCELCRVLGPQ